MTQLSDRPAPPRAVPDRAIPDLSAAVAAWRAGRNQAASPPGAEAEISPPGPGPEAAAETAPAAAAAAEDAGCRGERPKGGFLRGASRALKGLALAAVLAAALAALGLAATYMTFPRTGYIGSQDLPWLLPAGALAALAVAVAAWRGVHRLVRGHRADDVLTVISASVATAVSATGMWRVFTYVLHFPVDLRIWLFAFLELATVTCGIRARRNMKEFGSAGVDGILMWVFTCVSAFLSSVASPDAAEALFRLFPPLTAAALWERGLVNERRRKEGRKYQLTFSAERLLVKLGLAEPTGRTLGEIAAARRITVLALAAHRAHTLTAESGGWVHSLRKGRTERRLQTAMNRAVEYAGLATDPVRQRQLVEQLAVLRSASDLAALAPAAPWKDITKQMRGDGSGDGRRPRRGAGDGQPPTGPGHDRDERDEAGPSAADEMFLELADRLGEVIPGVFRDPMAPDAGMSIHLLLEGRDDYAAFIAWLGRSGRAKRLMAAAALYATGTISDRAPVQHYIASVVPGCNVDKREIRDLAKALTPVWREQNYPPPPAVQEAPVTAVPAGATVES